MADFAEALEKLSDVLAPSGLMLPFAGKTIPDGWLLCNGAAVSRTTYANLFAAIGTTWGTGDGSTTFNLPNCDSRFMEGTTDASKVGTYLEAGLPNITGEINFHGSSSSSSGCGIVQYVNNAFFFVSKEEYRPVWSSKTDDYKGSSHIGLKANLSNNIYGAKDTVQPAAYQTLIIIKV